MEVEFVLFGNVVVDDEINVAHIDSASRDVGCYHDVAFVVPEILHGPIALVLGEVPLERGDRMVGVRGEDFFNLHDLMLGPAEDEGPREFKSIDEGDDRVFLFSFSDLDVFLLNLMLMGEIAFDLDPIISRTEVFLRDFFYFRRNGRTEEGGLVRALNVGDHLVDVADEAHVEHFIAFIEDEVINVREI